MHPNLNSIRYASYTAPGLTVFGFPPCGPFGKIVMD